MLEMMMGLSPTVMRWATVGCKPVTPTSAGALARVPLYAVAHCCAAHGTATQLRTMGVSPCVAHIYEQSLVFRKRTAGRSEMTVGLKIDASR
jgi:hypothetical protein